MFVGAVVDGFNDDPISCWYESFCSDSQSFIWNWSDLPVDVLFSVNVKSAPVFVTLSIARNGPVSNLAFF